MRVYSTALAVLLSLGLTAAAQTVINNGDHHVVSTNLNSTYEVDYNTPGVSTHLEVATNGALAHAYMYEDSQFTLSGGRVSYIWAYDDSTLSLTTGSFGRMSLNGAAQLVLADCIGNSIGLSGNSHAVVFGSSFMRDDVPLAPGLYSAVDVPSEFWLNYTYNAAKRSLRMSLADSPTLYLAPEPSAILLLLIGARLVRQYRRA